MDEFQVEKNHRADGVTQDVWDFFYSKTFVCFFKYAEFRLNLGFFNLAPNLYERYASPVIIYIYNEPLLSSEHQRGDYNVIVKQLFDLSTQPNDDVK